MTAKHAKKKGRGLRMIVLLAVLAAIGAGGYFYWESSQRVRSTENAYVGADVATVSAQVSGPVVAVHVREGQLVRAGEPLFDVDPAPFEVALREAEAKLAQARQGNRANVADVDAAAAALARAEADVDNLRAQARRTHDLVASKFLSTQAEDDVQAKLKMSIAAAAESKSKLERAKQTAGTGASSGAATPAERAAEAQVELARLNLKHTHAVAASDGWIANLTLASGTSVTANQPLFSIIAKNSFRVDANFKETELPGLKPGQAATIELDMAPGVKYPGVVDVLGGGTGSAFSLLPPQNATGNWVKVTQRVPVRIRFTGEAANQPFRVGASAVVTVSVKDPG